MKYYYIFLSCLALAACSSGEVRSTLGLTRSSPDEFRVVSRPPLSVPPEFHLQPPRPGEAPLGTPAAKDVGRSLILQDSGSASTTRILQKPTVNTAVDPVISESLATSAESNFLSKAGAGAADPNIRQELAKEAKQAPETKDDVSPLESWMGIESSDPVVDPKAEADRIRTNKDEGKPVNEGEVKTIDRKNQSVIDRIF